MTKPGQGDPRSRNRSPTWPATIPEDEPLPRIPEEGVFQEEEKPAAKEAVREGGCGRWCGGIGEKLKHQLLKVLPAITIDASEEYRNQDQFRVQGSFIFNNKDDVEGSRVGGGAAQSSRYEKPKCIALQNGDIPDPPIYELKKRMRSISGEKNKAQAPASREMSDRHHDRDLKEAALGRPAVVVPDKEPLLESQG
ncbi:hypothetical protein FOL47_003196 [Perkinsus chesapeaki]|uniref:Uncharacterized protein n=1 Tax=Perkinsus chesapeaki TaxID=330153 RepID=A0A7J6M950_PERCH|nr:hypothetical protein FOL47_003196 [Perkinsus chesapeaki]